MMFADLKVNPEIRMDAIETWKLCMQVIGEMVKSKSSPLAMAGAMRSICTYMGWTPERVGTADQDDATDASDTSTYGVNSFKTMIG